MSAEDRDLSEWLRRDERVRRASAARLARVRDTIPVLQAIFAEHRVGEAYLFGSIAEGTPRPDSDVDIAVGQCPPEAFYRLAAKLERALSLPLDLVNLDRAPADIAAQIRGGGQRIYPSREGH